MKTAEKLKAIAKILADSFKFNEAPALDPAPVEVQKVDPQPDPAPAPDPVPQEFAAPKTAEELRALMEKFADGTPDEKINRMAEMLKAVFESVFSWELREAELVELKKKTERQGEAFKLQNQALTEILAVMGEFSEEAPAPDETPKDRVPFIKEGGKSRAEKVENLYKNLVAAKK